jgi:quercetin dioxygenase-like cupin family protein
MLREKQIPRCARDDKSVNTRGIAVCAMALIAVLSLGAQAPAPEPLAHGDVPGEPHHHLKIENEYVRVYYVEVPPRESTQLHQHDHDYLFVSLGASDVINAVRDKPEVHLVLRDGETHFTRGNFAHVARNLSDAPFRNITIELLKPQGEAHNECGDIIPGQGVAICDPPFVAVWHETQFETRESKLDLVWIFWKEDKKPTTSKLPFLVVGLTGPEVKINVSGKPPKTLRAGEMEWFDAGAAVQFSYEGKEAAQYLELTFKDSALRSRP